jgi:hypothetical protein
VIDAALTVRDIATVRGTALAAPTDNQAVRVDCRAANVVDFGCIPLLLAARLSASQFARQFALAASADAVLHAAPVQGGVPGTAGGDFFWSGDT